MKVYSSTKMIQGHTFQSYNFFLFRGWVNLATSPTYRFTEASVILQLLSICQRALKTSQDSAYGDAVIKFHFLEKAQISVQMTSEEISVTDKPRGYLLYLWPMPNQIQGNFETRDKNLSNAYRHTSCVISSCTVCRYLCSDYKAPVFNVTDTFAERAS